MITTQSYQLETLLLRPAGKKSKSGGAGHYVSHEL